jgi:hypothetical protein
MRRIYSISSIDEWRVRVCFIDEAEAIHEFVFTLRDGPTLTGLEPDHGFAAWVGAGKATPREVYQAIWAFLAAGRLAL